MARQGRGIFAEMFKDFIKSFKPKNFTKGNLIGTDYMGTKYFEVPADPQRGVRRPHRSFEPSVADKFDQNLPAEWEAWLRGRRKDPPTEEEINKNLGIIKLKEKNAAELKLKFPSKASENISQKKGMQSFPSYSEYEHAAGIRLDEKPEK